MVEASSRWDVSEVSGVRDIVWKLLADETIAYG